MMSDAVGSSVLSDENVLALPCAALTVHREGHVELANEAVTEFGYRPSAVRGQPVDPLVPVWAKDHPARMEQWFAAGRPRRMMGGLRTQLALVDASGSEIPVRIGLCPSEHEDVAVVIITRDVDHRWWHERQIMMTLLGVVLSICLTLIGVQVQDLSDFRVIGVSATGSLVTFYLMMIGAKARIGEASQL